MTFEICMYLLSHIPGEMNLLWSDLPEWNKKLLEESGATCRSLEFSALAARLLFLSYFPPSSKNICVGHSHAAFEIGG